MQCPKCGAPVNSGQKFCTKCGQTLVLQPTAPLSTMPTPPPIKVVGPMQPKMPQAPRPLRPQLSQAPRPMQPKMPQAPQPVAPQPQEEEKGFFNRLGAGIASALTGGSFSQGYDRQRNYENMNEALIQGVPMKVQDAQKTFANLKKKYPNAIEATDEVEFLKLIENVENAANDTTGNIAQQNGRIKKALAALDKKIYELKVKADPNLVGVPTDNSTPARQHHLSTAELHDINPDECAIVEHKATWGIQRGQIARRITERELDAVDGLNGVIIQQGCSAMVFVNGELVKVMEAGAYKLQVKSDLEMKKLIETLTNQLMQNHKDKVKTAEEAERQRLQNMTIAERGGLVGIAGSWIKRGLEFVFGASPVAKKSDKDKELEAMKRFKAEAEKIVKADNPQPLLSIILISNRFFNLTFGGVESEDGITFNPYIIPMGFLDVNIGVEVEMRISDITSFATNYLTDHNSLTTNDVFHLLNFDIENTVRLVLRNQEYTQQGLDANTRAQLSQQILASINRRLYGIECTQILNITDSQDDVFGRFREVEKEIYCSEKELEYMTRTGEIRNRMEQKQNRQLLNTAQNAADYNQAMLQIDKQGLLTEDERAEFVMMLETQRQVREATTKEEAYEKLLVLQGNRLVKEDELEAIKDAIEHDQINRAEITNIMRIQSNRNVEMERQQAEWALDDSKQDHDWQREDLERKRSWGIEDEEREREWMREEREFDRERNRLKAEEDYDFEKRMRQRSVDLEDHARERAEHIEDEERARANMRQDKFDDDQLEANRSARQMQNLEMAMKLQMQQEAQEQMHAQNMATIQANEQMNRDNHFANMSAEQIRAAQLSHLTGDAQVAMANAYGSAQQAADQKALYDQMLAQQNAQNSQSQQMMMQMAQMMQQGMMGVAGVQMANQRQQMDQLRADRQYAQERQDHAQDQAFAAMGGVATAAASNLYTQNVNTHVNVQQPQPVQQSHVQQTEQETFEYQCYNCGHMVRICQGMPKCPDCGAPFLW